MRPDNARKRKKSFIRLVRANLVGETPPTLLTLTMNEIRSIGDAWLASKEFIIRDLKEMRVKIYDTLQFLNFRDAEQSTITF